MVVEDKGGVPRGFWGKLRRDSEDFLEWHPLADHCADVAAVCEALLLSNCQMLWIGRS
jgi:HD domain